MEDGSRCISHQDRTSLEDLYWFYAKSKVPICLAITECCPFLERFTKAGILSEETSLMLQADTRPVHRVIYESLCWIEENDFASENFFKILFQKPFLKLYPNLKPIYNGYKQGNYKSALQTSTDKEQDQIIFAQEKVKICLEVTDIFPFIHGLQDMTFLSEIESLKFQADGRPVSRVIYDCLSLIEKKDLKLSFVFEYIFQPCYQTLYPGLKAILQECNVEQVGPFNGKPLPVFNSPGGLLQFYENNKSDISAAINECFPFLNGLHDMELLPKIELLKLEADKRNARDVLYEALNCIQKSSDMEGFFIYLFREFYLKRFPKLKTILLRLNKALILDMCLPIQGVSNGAPDMEDNVMQQTRKRRLKPKCYTGLSGHYWKPTGSSEENADMAENVMQQPRKCRLTPICYTELSDYDWELTRGSKRNAGKGVQTSTQQKLEKDQCNKIHIPKNDAMNVRVKLEFPKRLFDSEFHVICGHKKGLFIRERWTGDSRNDKCIKCDKNMFTVIQFEKYGGRGAAKNWKKSLRCAGLTIEKLFQFGILKSPSNIKQKQ